MPRIRPCSAAAELMARSIALLAQSCSRNVGRSVAVKWAKRRSLGDINCQRVSSFTRSARFGAAAAAAKRKFWQAATVTHCSSRLRTEARRLRFPRSVAEHIASRFQKQRRLLLDDVEVPRKQR